MITDDCVKIYYKIKGDNMDKRSVASGIIAGLLIISCNNADAANLFAKNNKDSKQATQAVKKPEPAKPVQAKADAVKQAAAKETPAKSAIATGAGTESRKLTKQEMVADLENILRYHPDFIASMQGMQRSGEGDKAQFTFEGKPLGEMDETTLTKMLSSARGQVSAENLQRLERQQRQLRQMQQIDQMNRTQRMMQQQRAITAANNANRASRSTIPRPTR